MLRCRSFVLLLTLVLLFSLPAWPVQATLLPAAGAPPVQEGVLSTAGPSLEAAGPANPPGPKVDAGWWAAVQEDIQRSEYEITWQDTTSLPDLPAAYQSPNRAHNLRTYFTDEGIRVIPREGVPPAWEVGLALAGAGPAELAVTGNRVEYAREGGTEWYVNTEEGLQQGFEIRNSNFPNFELGISTGLTPQLTADGTAVEIHDASGATVLRYGDFQATDAAGRPVPLQLRLSSSHTLQVVFSNLQPATCNFPAPLTLHARLTSPAPASPTGLPGTPNWTVLGERVGDWYSFSLGTAGDVDGDGYSDVIVSAPHYDNGASNTGRAYVYLGSATGLSTTPAWLANSGVADGQLGWSVGTAGDVNGDGYSDVIVGANWYGNGDAHEGAAFVWYGSATGLGENGTPANADWTVEGAQLNAEFGVWLGTAGDVNGDGYSDVIVGAVFYDNGQTDEGAVFSWYGSADGLGAGGTPDSADWRAESNQADAHMGSVVGTAGDVNGDGYSDVIADAEHYDNGQTDEGAAFVWYGSAGGLGDLGDPTNADWRFETDQAGAGYISPVSTAGDVNGDGYSDVIIGSSGYNTHDGATFAFYGSAGGLGANGHPGNADWTASNQPDSEFGTAVGTAGDVNGDGYGDVIVGQVNYDNDQGNEGRAYVYYGSSTGLAASAAWTVEGNQVDARLGDAVGTAGDVNGDGYSDVIVGAWQWDITPYDWGAAWVYHGSSDGLGATGSPADWTAETNQAGASVGPVGTAGDVNGDGYGDVIVGCPYYDNGETDEGLVYVYLGSATGLGTSPAWTAEGDQADAIMGTGVGTAGDVNGDGYSDVVIGAARYDNGQANEGLVFVWYGSATGLGENGTPANADWLFETNQADSTSGVAIATAGDVNGDGYGDIVLGAWTYDNGATDTGAAWAFYGSATGLGENGTPANADWTCGFPVGATAHLGNSVGPAGDVNGDGYGDVIVTADWYPDEATKRGLALVYHGSANGLSATPAWQITGTQAGDQFGAAARTAGDVNGDGYSDIVVGAIGYDNGEFDEGRAYVYHGSADGLATIPNWTAESNQTNAVSGFSVGTAGDVNGDGYSDVVIGAPYFDAGEMDEGRVFVYYGSPTGLSTTYPLWQYESNQTGAMAGWSVGTAGDVNGDGYSDLIIGTPWYDNGQDDEGRAWLFYGNDADGLDLLPRQMRTDGVTPIDHLGASDPGAFQLQLTGRMPLGRADVRLQWQVAPLGMPITSTEVISGVSGWTDVLTTGVVISQSVTGLELGTPYHWRVRLLYRPGNALGQPAGRWVTIPWAGWNEADLRTCTFCPPVAGDDTFTTTEDIVLSIPAPGVLANDTDPNSDPLTATLALTPTSGTLLLALDGSFVYTPALNFNGVDAFGYVASDGMFSDTATVLLTITAVNDAPVSADDYYSTPRDTPLTVTAPGVLSNDNDPEGDPLTPTLDVPPVSGTVVLNLDGSFIYTPSAGIFGVDTFTYIVSDGALTDTALVSIDVGATNHTPVAQDDAYTATEDIPLQIAAPGVLENDLDPDSDPLTAMLATLPAHGTVALNADGSFVYTPDSNFNGVDAFGYVAGDGWLTDTATVSLTVTAVNDAPVAQDDSYTTSEDIRLTVPAPGVLVNDTDVDGDTLTAVVVTGPVHGTLVLNPNGSFAYTPMLNWNGSDSFTYAAGDGHGGSDTAVVALTVTPVNDAPIAADDDYTTTVDTPLVVAAPGVLGNDLDPEGDPLVAVLGTPPAQGTVVLHADGSFVYTPTAGFTGTVAFTYRASDGETFSAPAVVTTGVGVVPVHRWMVYLPIIYR